MKKFLLPCLLALGMTATAQTYFSDDFNDENVSDWTRYDVDGDTRNWADIFFVPDQAGNPTTPVSLISRSWQVNALTPDNWIISPAINLTSATGQLDLNWKVKCAAAEWDNENYSVYVATSPDMAALSASPVTFTETYDDPADAGTQYTRSLDVSSFAGQTIYVAFRHHAVTDMDYISIDDVMVKAPDTVAPNCPTLSAPANASTTVNPGTVTLSWAAAASGAMASSYDVYFGTTPNPTTLLGNVSGTSTTATVAPSTTYYWRVIAKNSVGSATGCTEYSFTTTANTFCTSSPNGAFGTLTPSTCNGTTAVTRTTAWAGEYSTVNVVAGRTYKFDILLKTGYFITIATNETTPVGLASGTNSVTYTATTTGALRFYSHTDSACGSGTSATSHTRSVTCMATMAVSDVNKTGISVYPNPFVDVLKISDVKGVKSVSVNDISGREVKSLAPSAELNLSSLKAGLYIVNLKMEDGSVKTFKAIKK